jgi:hypothetical protein
MFKAQLPKEELFQQKIAATGLANLAKIEHKQLDP